MVAPSRKKTRCSLWLLFLITCSPTAAARQGIIEHKVHLGFVLDKGTPLTLVTLRELRFPLSIIIPPMLSIRINSTNDNTV
jgi:hypothetical protein